MSEEVKNCLTCACPPRCAYKSKMGIRLEKLVPNCPEWQGKDEKKKDCPAWQEKGTV